jgi:glycosyltransferase involved in cell wall biosynthesis
VRILVVTNMYPPHSLGGYEQTCRDAIHRWRSHGHQVEILTTTTRMPGVTGDLDPAVHRDLEWYWADHEILRPSPRERLHIERANRRCIDRHLESFGPDVVSFWAMGAMSLSIIGRCVDVGRPVVLVVADDWLVYGPKVDGWAWMCRRLPGWLAAAASRATGVPTRLPSIPPQTPLAIVSAFLTERARALSSLGPPPAVVMPPGIDPRDFPLTERLATTWGWRCLAVGRIEPRKGFDVAIRALAELPEATLRLVGPADARHAAALGTLAADLEVGDRLSIEPGVSRGDLASVYRSADVEIFPSRWDEPFGLVPLEAMSQSTPVVATRRGGSAEYLSDGDNCLEVPVDDPSAVAAAIQRLASDAPLRRHLVDGGLATAARYNADRYADDLEALHVAAAEPAIDRPARR